MVEQPLPFEVDRGFSKAFGMRLESFPLGQKEIPVFRFQAALQFVGDVARALADILRSLPKIALEGRFLSGLHVQDRDFKDHRG